MAGWRVTEIRHHRNLRAVGKSQAEVGAFQGAFSSSLRSSALFGGGDEIQMWLCPLAFQPTKPWQVLTAVSRMGAVRLGGGKRAQVTPPKSNFFCLGRGAGSAPRVGESPC